MDDYSILTYDHFALVCFGICALAWSIAGLAFAWAKWKESQSWVALERDVGELDKDDWWEKEETKP